MNRYVVDGLLADMRSGLRVLVLSNSQYAARDAFQQVAERLQTGETARRGHGLEQCIGAGRIRFVTAHGNAMRGETADVIFADVDLSPDEFCRARPALASSSRGEFLRA